MFSIDDDAYHNLGDYLNSLSKYFENEQGGNEIITDIEIRIAELFAERSGGISQIVTNGDVLQAIETLGRPEDIADSEIDESNSNSGKRRKRLYRDPGQRILGGVCGGIASWLGISVVIVRLLFIAACYYGLSILAYFALWIVIPLARTARQKLEMQGQAVNINNMKNIKEQMSSSGLGESLNQFTGEAGGIINKLFRVCWIVFGIALCVAGIAIVLACGSLFFVQDFIFIHEIEWDFFSFNELLKNITSHVSYNILAVCATLIIGLTVFACFYWGIKILSRSKVTHGKLQGILAIIWFLAIPTGFVTILYEANNYKWNNETNEVITINANDTIYLTMKPSPLKISNNPLEVYYDRENNRFYGKPDLYIRKSDDCTTIVEIRKKARGKNRLDAFHYAEDIVYDIDTNDSTIAVSPYFTVAPQDKWKFQELKIILYVPENTVIIANDSLCNDKILRNWFYSCDHAYIYTSKWIMTKNNGLKAINN
jgi:phage shock protein PspC (stress-responsive transcriptional regulator)